MRLRFNCGLGTCCKRLSDGSGDGFHHLYIPALAGILGTQHGAGGFRLAKDFQFLHRALGEKEVSGEIVGCASVWINSGTTDLDAAGEGQYEERTKNNELLHGPIIQNAQE
jgi:hypothetical protein